VNRIEPTKNVTASARLARELGITGERAGEKTRRPKRESERQRAPASHESHPR
jgi:hypothetical protein